MNTFETYESNVRSYCRIFPEVFERARGSYLYSESGRAYLDFFAGAGALNYGHNNPYIKRSVLGYLQEDNILHALDMYTSAKRRFIETFQHRILRPRALTYKMQFCGPTGANGVETALKLARKATQRPGVFALRGSFHGMSLGALAVSSNRSSRAAAGISLNNTVFVPFPGQASEVSGSIEFVDALLQDTHSGVERPAAVILETVQAEGGVNVAPIEWLRRLRELCDKHGLLMICDDVQVGCFRTGPFFSFERAAIVPDIVVLSKSIGGIGFPMSLVLLKSELDCWKPGEHTGTFRGNQTALVAAAAAIDWALENEMEQVVRAKEALIRGELESWQRSDPRLAIRGIGMIWGVDLTECGGRKAAESVVRKCFETGLIIEPAGRDDAVVKLLPPLTTSEEELTQGLKILRDALNRVLSTEDSGTTSVLSTDRAGERVSQVNAAG